MCNNNVNYVKVDDEMLDHAKFCITEVRTGYAFVHSDNNIYYITEEVDRTGLHAEHTVRDKNYDLVNDNLTRHHVLCRFFQLKEMQNYL